ncbi:MAG: glycosyltransferase family 87 protein [Nitrososphaerales archaeon]
MWRKTRRAKLLLFVGFAALIAMNLYTFSLAYPQISVIDSGCCANHPLAKDFSAFYIGAWRLFNSDPAGVYFHGYLNDGETKILPQPEQYKYLPAFLSLVAPFLLLSYPNALIAFDAFQLLLLPIIAFLVYKLVGEKGMLLTFLVGVIALLLPSISSAGWGFSIAYFWQWKEGQSKVLETFLILFSLFFAKRGNPKLSGLFLGLSFFDPRFSLVSLPLFLVFNKNRIYVAVGSLAITGVLTNLTLLYPSIGSGFLSMLLSTGLVSGFYPYAFIPFLTVVAISIVYYEEIMSPIRIWAKNSSSAIILNPT